MSELLKLPFLSLGPRVAIVDDVDEDGMPLEEGFDNLEISNQYYKVDITDPHYPAQPLKDLEMLFLDLHFWEGFGARFDPYLCINWIERIVPTGQKYVLVIWSRDIELKEELLAAMEEMRITRPYYTGIRRKQQYRQGDNTYDVPRLLNDVGEELRQNVEIQTHYLYGQILEVEDDAVLINCLLNVDPKVFEVRRFELQPFKNYIDLIPDTYINIKITTKPGSTSIEFNPEEANLTEKFVKPDTDDFGDTEWLNTSEE